MQIDVRDKSFDITFVNNWCREKYQEMLEYIDEISELPAKYDEIKDADKDKSVKLKELKELNTHQHDLTRLITQVRTDIIKELLDTNGYEYDEKFWKRKTDVDDLNDFMLTCMQKDLSKSTSKKK